MLKPRFFTVALAAVCFFSQAALATKISLGSSVVRDCDICMFTDIFEITDQNFKTTKVSVQWQLQDSSVLRAQNLKEAIDQAVMNHLIDVTVSVAANEVSINSTNFTFSQNENTHWGIFLESNDIRAAGGRLHWMKVNPSEEAAYFARLLTSTTSYVVEFQDMDVRRSGLSLVEYAKDQFERQGATGLSVIDGNLAFSNAYIGFEGSDFNSTLIGSLSAAPVPEPSTFVLTALGLAGIGIVTSRRSRRLLPKPFARV